MRISDWSSDVCSSDLAALLGLYVCRGGQLYRARLAHLRFPLHPLSADVDELCAGRRHLYQFLCAPLATRHPLAALRRDGAALLALSDMVPPAAPPPPARSEEHTSELQSLMRISYAV